MKLLRLIGILCASFLLMNACKKLEGIAILPYEIVKEQIKQGEFVEIQICDVDLSRNLVICYHKDKYIKKEKVHTIVCTFIN